MPLFCNKWGMPRDDAPSAGAAAEVSLDFFLPAPDLRPAISTYYVLRLNGDAPVEDLVHPEWANIRLLLAGDWSLTFEGGRTSADVAPSALVSGTLSKSAKVRGGPGFLVGVGLMPAGWARLTEQSAAAYADTLRPLSDLVGDAAGELIARLGAAAHETDYFGILDEWFRAQLAPPAAVEALLNEAHRHLLDPELASVGEWARRLGRSTRQLERMTLDYFGVPPKRLLRRQRFLRTFAAMRDQPPGAWGRLLDDRYADQSQFVREFNHFIGMSPRAYFSRRWPFMLAAGNARQALLGVPLQGLHKAE